MSICSLNCRELGHKTKREQVFHWLKEQHFSIYLLQETHLNSQLSDKWESEWGCKSFFSGNANNSEGVSILFNKSFAYDIVNYTEIILSRLIAVDIKLEHKILKVIDIYGPNDGNIHLFEKLHNYIHDNEENDFIIGGDFNTVLNTNIDKRNGRKDTHKKCRLILLCYKFTMTYFVKYSYINGDYNM